MTSPRSERLLVVLAVLVTAGVVVLSAGRTWASGTAQGISGAVPVRVDGGEAVPAVVALALATLAAAVVLATAGRVVRLLAAGFVVVAGAGVAATAGRVRGSLAVLEPEVEKATGTTTGQWSGTATAWPLVVTAAGGLLVLLGLVALVRARRWPGPSKRYEREPTESPGRARPRDAVAADDDWAALSRGEDPTSTPDGTARADLPD